jgi:hypothetical protein
MVLVTGGAGFIGSNLVADSVGPGVPSWFATGLRWGIGGGTWPNMMLVT